MIKTAKGVAVILAVPIIFSTTNALSAPGCDPAFSICGSFETSQKQTKAPKAYQPYVVKIYENAFRRYETNHPQPNPASDEYFDSRWETGTREGLRDAEAQLPWYKSLGVPNQSARDYLESYLPTIASYIVFIEGYIENIESLPNNPTINATIQKQKIAIAKLRKLALVNGAWDERNVEKIHDWAYDVLVQGVAAYKASRPRTTPSTYQSTPNPGQDPNSRYNTMRRCGQAYPSHMKMGGDKEGYKACMKMNGFPF